MTNDAYAIAKIAGFAVQAVRRQHGSWISAMPTNLYGPGDNFFAVRARGLLPAILIRRYDEASQVVRSTTKPGHRHALTESLHVDDLASACLYLEHFDGPTHVNVGTGTTTPRETAEMVASAW